MLLFGNLGVWHNDVSPYTERSLFIFEHAFVRSVSQKLNP